MFTYVARQAIYDTQKRVFAYELLFRDGLRNCFPDISPDKATNAIVSDTHLSIGVENLCSNKPAFINFHQNTIENTLPSTLDPLDVVLEIVESVDLSKAFIDACKQLKRLGYKIALDDYDFSDKWIPLLPYVHYIKVEANIINLDDPKIQHQLATLKQEGKVLIAEKVESHGDFERYKQAGFDYFQGYFLSVPEVVKHKTVDVLPSSILELISLSAAKELNFEALSEVFEKDLGLTYKLMRFINNPMVNKRQNIDSLHHAIRYLGINELRKFIALLAVNNLRGNKPEDLVMSSLVRAHFCKLMAAPMQLKDNPPSSYILGLFSHIDALLDMPMTDIMQSLPFSDDVKQALCETHVNTSLALQLRICIAFERADWAVIYDLSQKAKIAESELFDMYYAAVNWADEMQPSLGEECA